MAARPISSATISFGMVSVPIHMYSASESSAAISFNWINKKTGARCKQQYIDEKTQEKVEKEDMMKGREFSKGHYVLFTPDEIKAMEEKKDTGTVSITEFVPADQVERLYFDKGYFIGPGKGGEKAYGLLAAAMKKTGLVAIGQYVARGKQYLVMIRPKDGGLVLETLHYADELRSMKDVEIPDTEVKDKELDLALQIIAHLKKDEFRPEQYKDAVKERIQQQIQLKIDGQEIVAEPTEAPETQILDLMEALKASLAKSRGKKPETPAKQAKVKAIGKKKSA
jgi:DNA end-binding protein Ku